MQDTKPQNGVSKNVNLHAHWYSARKPAIYEATIKVLQPYLSRSGNGALLDIGCGYGHIAHALANSTQYTVTAIDNNDDVISTAKRLFPSIRFEKQSVFSLPYDDASFDVVISTGYRCAASLPTALWEIRRVLKPDGVLLLDYQRHYHLYALAHLPRLLRQLSGFCSKSSDQYHFGRFGLPAHFRRHDLQIRRIQPFYTWPPFLSSTRAKLFFENSLGKVLRLLLARIFIVVVDPI